MPRNVCDALADTPPTDPQAYRRTSVIDLSNSAEQSSSSLYNIMCAQSHTCGEVLRSVIIPDDGTIHCS